MSTWTTAPAAPCRPPAGPSPDFAEAAAAIEHEHAVVPLLDLFDTDPQGLHAAVRTGGLRASLGLFTPNARFSARAAALTGVQEGDRVILEGRVCRPATPSDVTLIAVDTGEQTRLALLSHSLPGVHVHGTPDAGRESGHLVVEKASLPLTALSRPVSWDGEGQLVTVLDAFSRQFARHAAGFAVRLIGDLRRVLAATGEGKEALSTSQYTSHEISRLEIEATLASAAAARGAGPQDGAGGGQAVTAVLLACLDVLRRGTDLAGDLCGELGLPPVAGFDPSASAAARTFFGGRRMVEGELAHRMGLTAEAAGR
ncbi:hypothetical protein AB0L10_37375 [Streptomyces flaveolus]|uniref:hypothetical protein n=1 Tax=Streptomyces flaveolus TaxID=67297 RepID=UPI00343D11B9